MQDILGQMVDETMDALIFNPAFRVQEKSGRVTDLSGMVGMTREMKEAAFIGNTHVYNYDLVASQQSITALVCEAWGIDPSPIRTFDRAALMDATGMHKEDAKALIYATFFGAVVPVSAAQGATMKKPDGSPVTVHATLERVAEYSDLSLEELYNKTAPVLRPISDTMQAVAAYYMGPFFDAHASKGGRAGRVLRNASGITTPRLDVSDRDERNDAIVHLLQGTEAAVGHALISIQDKYNYRVLLHEHDGVVTEGRIPPSAVQEALRLVTEAAGFDVTGLELVLKPYNEVRPDHWAHATHSTTEENHTNMTTESPWSYTNTSSNVERREFVAPSFSSVLLGVWPKNLQPSRWLPNSDGKPLSIELKP